MVRETLYVIVRDASGNEVSRIPFEVTDPRCSFLEMFNESFGPLAGLTAEIESEQYRELYYGIFDGDGNLTSINSCDDPREGLIPCINRLSEGTGIHAKPLGSACGEANPELVSNASSNGRKVDTPKGMSTLKEPKPIRSRLWN